MDRFTVDKINNGYILTSTWDGSKDKNGAWSPAKAITLAFPSLQEVYGHLKNCSVELEKTLWEGASHRITDLQKRIERLENRVVEAKV